MEPLFYGLPLRAVELALRLPPLYLMDNILIRDMGLTEPIFPGMAREGEATLTTSDGQKVHLRQAPPGANLTEALMGDHGQNASHWEEVYASLYGGSADAAVLPYYAVNLTAGLCIYLAATFIVTLNARSLLALYAHLAAAAVIPASFLSHSIMLETLGQVRTMEGMGLDDDQNAEWFLHRYLDFTPLGLEARAVLANYLVQTSLGLFLAHVLKRHFAAEGRDLLTKLVTFSVLSPNVPAALGLPTEAVHASAVCSLALPAVLVAWAGANAVRAAFRHALGSYRRRRQILVNFGLNVFLEAEWVRLRVPVLLRTFWLSRVGLHFALALMGSEAFMLAGPATLPDATQALQATADMAQHLATRGAETTMALLGMTSVVSAVCHYVGSFFHLVLIGGVAGEDEEERSAATISAVLFFVLALQTGLTSLEPEKRFSRLCKNLCLLLAALFHFIHNMVGPVLTGLSASHSFKGRRHARALFICAFLVLAPLALMAYLWQTFQVGTWLLAVSAFCVEVVVKVTVTVAVYVLFLYDAYFKDGLWEGLDDAVYVVKAAGSSVEFCFAVFLFFNGGWILLFESGGTIRALMMLIHGYCNIWLEAKAGWQTFVKRRTAVAKLDRLPDATAEELASHDDVCAICYQPMRSSAKVTRCRHFFHGVCLRKWLYVQDSCPLCHRVLFGQEDRQEEQLEDEDQIQALDPYVQVVAEQPRADQEGREVAERPLDLPDEVIDNDESDEEVSDSSSSYGFQQMEEESSSSDDEDENGDNGRGQRAQEDDDDDLIYDSAEDGDWDEISTASGSSGERR